MANPTTASRARRRWTGFLSVLATCVAVTVPATARADAAPKGPATTFHHVGTFGLTDNLPPDEPRATPTSAEIVDVTADGRELVYTDALTERLGVVGLDDIEEPAAAGTVDLGGEPTSVAVAGKYALVAVDTSTDFVAPSGELVVVGIATREVLRRIPLAGQPDAVDVSPDHRYAAVVIENQRDEDLGGGLIPQLPGGTLEVFRLAGPPAGWSARAVDLTGLADIAPSDPEPEFVDINRRNQAVVTLQENNHLAVVDLPSAAVVHHFSAGTVDIDAVDTVEEELGPQENGLISLDGALADRRREPDAVAWVDDDTVVTANEGDYEDPAGVEGGTRSFTLFHAFTGTVEFEAGNSFEHEIVRAGHYPEGRSENKGNEPEGVAVGRFGPRTLLFVGAERANVVGVYDLTSGMPRFLQLLPTGMGPEGIRPIPQLGALAVSAEVDGLAEEPDDQFPVRSLITLYQLGPDAPSYPHVVSGTEAGLPIPWVALSGLSADPSDDDVLWAVSDSFLAQSWIYRIDAGQRPARITQRIAVGGPDGAYDLEGIAAHPDGGFWLASEGRGNDDRRNLLVRTDGTGNVLAEVGLPPALVAKDTSSGFEGVALTGDGPSETLTAVIQREWEGGPAGAVYLARYHVATGTWTFAWYPLDAVESPAGGWVGLSEITPTGDDGFLIVERDNQLGADARVKRIYAVELTDSDFAPFGGPLPTVDKTLFADVLDDLDAASISVPDKLEGMAVAADRLWLATDNDGVDENYGETLFFPLG